MQNQKNRKMKILHLLLLILPSLLHSQINNSNSLDSSFYRVNQANSINMGTGLQSKTTYVADYRSKIDSTHIKIDDNGIEIWLKDTVNSLLIYGDNINEPFFQEEYVYPGRYWFAFIYEDTKMIYVIKIGRASCRERV
mgnify:CR=1 FL=1